MSEHKQASGVCPYCSGASFSEGDLRRPMQRVDRCNACDKYSVLNLRNGARYPVSDPTDAESPPRV